MKAQVAAEFIIMIGVSITLGIVLIATLSFFLKEQISEQNIEIAKEVLISVENELFLSTTVESGYTRSFEVPLKLNNEEYNISSNRGDLIITYKEIQFIGRVPNMTGEIIKGTNVVRNIDGRICLNEDNC